MDNNEATASLVVSVNSEHDLRTELDNDLTNSAIQPSVLLAQVDNNTDDWSSQPPSQYGKPSSVVSDCQNAKEELHCPSTPMEEDSVDLHSEKLIEQAGQACELRAPASLTVTNIKPLQIFSCNSKGNKINSPSSNESDPLCLREDLVQEGNFPSSAQSADIKLSKNLVTEFNQFSDYKTLKRQDKEEAMFGQTTLSKKFQNFSLNFIKPTSDSMKSGFKPNQNNKTEEKLDSTVLHISQSFLNANKSTINVTVPTYIQQRRSFAQVATPKIVAASIPTKGSSPQCGLLVDRIKNSTLDDYAKVIEANTGKGTLIFLGQSPQDQEKVMAFLEKPELVDKLVLSGITVRGRWLCVSYLHQPATKLIISDVLPFVSDEIVLNACKEFGQPVHEHLRRIPSSVRAKEFKHVLSYRRELLIILDKDKPVPDHIVVFSHDNFYKLGVTTPGLTCYNCKQQGHRAVFCKKPRSHTEQTSEEQAWRGEEQTEFQALQQPGDLSTYEAKAKHQLDGLKILQRLEQTNSREINANQKELEKPTDQKQTQVKIMKDKPSIINNSGNTKMPHQVSVLHAPHYLATKNLVSTKTSPWRFIGKKGKIISSLNELSKLAKSPKTPKRDRFSDTTWIRQYAPSKDASLSSDESPDDQSMEQVDSPVLLTSTKRKKDKRSQENPIIKQTGDSVKGQKDEQLNDASKTGAGVLSQTSKKKDVPLEEQASILQLKEIIDLFRQQPGKTKASKKEFETSHPIIEKLLLSVGSMRTTKRRAIINDFTEKYDQLPKYIDTILSLIPSSYYGSQIYKVLSGIKQDIKCKFINDNRKVRYSKIPE